MESVRCAPLKCIKFLQERSLPCLRAIEEIDLRETIESIQVMYAFSLALLTFAMLMRTLIMKVTTDDLPSTYKLFAVRDSLVRLVVEGTVSRTDPYLFAMYENVVILLRSSRLMSGPEGWPVAASRCPAP